MRNLLLNPPTVSLLSLHLGWPRLAGLLTLGMATACVVSVGDDWDGSPQACYEHYEDCLDDAWPFGDSAIDACENLLDSCIEDCSNEDNDSQAEGTSSSGDSGNSDDGDDGDDGDDDGGDGDPETGTDTESETGDGDGPDPACFDLHATCVAAAQTIQDVEACEALFDNCIDPGPCDEPGCEEPGCPQAELDACVDSYAGCAQAAETPQDVLACAGDFDDCIAQFDVSLCLPNYDDQLVLECLAQHELCTACADDAGEIAACKSTFDNCLEA
jgi:hypothetical protein